MSRVRLWAGTTAAVLLMAAPASADLMPLEFHSYVRAVNLPLQMPERVTGQGVAEVGGDAIGRLTRFKFEGTLHEFATTIPGNGSVVTVTGTGKMTNVEFEPGEPLRWALKGQTTLCLLLANCVIPFTIPLTVNSTRGVGLGGVWTVNTFALSGPRVSLVGAPWTVGPITITTVDADGKSVKIIGGGGGYGLGTSQEYGTVTPCPSGKQCGGFALVSRVVVSTNEETRRGMILMGVRFVPEPDQGVLLLAGIGGLLCLGYRRLGESS